MPMAAYAFNLENGQELLSELIDMLNGEGSNLSGGKTDSKREYAHIAFNCCDRKTGIPVAKSIVTIHTHDGVNEIIDGDIISARQCIKKLHFLHKVGRSSDACEFYAAEDEGGRHFYVQTVNRHIIEGDIEDKELDVALTITPFKITVYNDMAEHAKANGMGSITLPEIDGMEQSDQSVYLADDFAAPSSMMTDDPNDIFSMVLGRVIFVEEHDICFGKCIIPAYYIEIASGDERISVLTGKSMFEKNKIRIGKQLEIFGDVKADFSVNNRTYYGNI